MSTPLAKQWHALREALRTFAPPLDAHLISIVGENEVLDHLLLECGVCLRGYEYNSVEELWAGIQTDPPNLGGKTPRSPCPACGSTNTATGELFLRVATGKIDGFLELYQLSLLEDVQSW